MTECDICGNDLFPVNPYMGDEANAYANCTCEGCGTEYELQYGLVDMHIEKHGEEVN